MTALKKWFRWVIVLPAVIATLFFVAQGRKHRNRQEGLEHRAKQIEKDMGASHDEFIAAKKRADAAADRASAAVNEAEARINDIKQTDADIATRVDRYRRRRLQRRGS